jgi:uncharacterized membrane protein YfcA
VTDLLIGPLAIVWVLGVVLVGSAVQSLLGFGFALVVVPLLMGIVGVRDAVVLVTFGSIVNTALIAHGARGSIPVRRVAGLLAGCLAGLPVGLAALLWASEESLRLGVGVTTVVTALALAAGVRPMAASVVRDLGVGFVSGVLNTSTSMNGPPVVLYLQALGTPPAEFRGALALFFTITSAVSVAAFVAAGVPLRRATLLALAALPAVAAGHALGHTAFRRVDARRFRRVVLAVLVVTGAVAAASVLVASIR